MLHSADVSWCQRPDMATQIPLTAFVARLVIHDIPRNPTPQRHRKVHKNRKSNRWASTVSTVLLQLFQLVALHLPFGRHNFQVFCQFLGQNTQKPYLSVRHGMQLPSLSSLLICFKFLGFQKTVCTERMYNSLASLPNGS